MIEIVCDTCKKSVIVAKVSYDPENAVKMTGTVCPDCDKGGNYIDQSEMNR